MDYLKMTDLFGPNCIFPETEKIKKKSKSNDYLGIVKIK